jgi:polyketide cyclase/dehydrase/lipid transport protein
MKKLLIGFLGLIVVVVIVGFFLPTTYAVDTRITVNATPAQVHAMVGDLERWPSWVPWQEDDPSLETTLGDKTTGVGASQSWTSDSGNGELVFTFADPAVGIEYDLNFIVDGDRTPSKCAVKYEVVGDTVVVVWTMSGDVADMMPPIAAGYLGIFLPDEIAKMFDRGLASLKSQVEGGEAE